MIWSQKSNVKKNECMTMHLCLRASTSLALRSQFNMLKIALFAYCSLSEHTDGKDVVCLQDCLQGKHVSDR